MARRRFFACSVTPAPARPRLPSTSREGIDGKVAFAAFTGKAALVMRAQGLRRRQHDPQPDLPGARERRGNSELRSVGRGAGLEGQAHRDRRMFDGRCGTRPRSQILRRAAAGARRSGAIAADFRRRIFHRRRARRDADRSASPGARQSDHPPVDGRARRRAARARRLRWRQWRTRSSPATISIRRASSPPIRCWSDATIRGAPTIRACANGAAFPTRCRWPATSWCVCATTGARVCSTAACGRSSSARRRAGEILKLHLTARREHRQPRASRCRCGRNASPATIDALEWPQRKKYDEFDYGYVLTVHKAQGSQWDDVVLFDESFAFPDSRARWLYTGITRAAKTLTVVV